MTNAQLLDLLQAARSTLIELGGTVAYRGPHDGTLTMLVDSASVLEKRIGAALAERQDSATDVVESKVWWWQDKVIRAIVDGNAVTIQTNAPNHWFWSVSFVTRKDQYGLCERRDGISTTEAEAKAAALKAARGMR